MFKCTVKNRLGFEYSSRNKDATAHICRNLHGKHAIHSLKFTMKIAETIEDPHHLEIFGYNVVPLVGENKLIRRGGTLDVDKCY